MNGIDCKGRKWIKIARGAAKDISNIKFNKLQPLFRVNGDFVKDKNSYWLCQCDCGNQIIEKATELRYGKIHSCGCYKKEYLSINKSDKLDGQKFNKLLVLEAAGSTNSQKRLWKCLCDCGNITYVTTGDLKNGHIASCGCLRRKSLGEQKIEQLLKENNIKYIHNKGYFKNLILSNGGIGRYDFVLLDENEKPYRLIEFDGIQHFEEQDYFTHSLTETKNNDIIKNKYAKENNIPLVRIPYWERDKMTLEMLLGKEYLIE